MTKRNLFGEINEGLEHLKKARLEKTTLRSVERDFKPAAIINAEEVVAIRERLNLSRSVFASYLRTNVRTLENWEQGRAKPNAQAALLIHLVDRYPETVKKIASVQLEAKLSYDISVTLCKVLHLKNEALVTHCLVEVIYEGKTAGLSRPSACSHSEGGPMEMGRGRMHKLVWFSHEKG